MGIIVTLKFLQGTELCNGDKCNSQIFQKYFLEHANLFELDCPVDFK